MAAQPKLHQPIQVGIIQPGTGIELVLNEATQRKSSSTAGFNSQVLSDLLPLQPACGPTTTTTLWVQDERVYGNEAQNLLGKLPAKQFVLSKILLGALIGSPQVRQRTTHSALQAAYAKLRGDCPGQFLRGAEVPLRLRGRCGGAWRRASRPHDHASCKK